MARRSSPHRSTPPRHPVGPYPHGRSARRNRPTHVTERQRKDSLPASFPSRLPSAFASSPPWRFSDLFVLRRAGPGPQRLSRVAPLPEPQAAGADHVDTPASASFEMFSRAFRCRPERPRGGCPPLRDHKNGFSKMDAEQEELSESLTASGVFRRVPLLG